MLLKVHVKFVQFQYKNSSKQYGFYVPNFRLVAMKAQSHDQMLFMQQLIYLIVMAEFFRVM